jgi:hypothetical protein
MAPPSAECLAVRPPGWDEAHNERKGCTIIVKEETGRLLEVETYNSQGEFILPNHQITTGSIGVKSFTPGETATEVDGYRYKYKGRVLKYGADRNEQIEAFIAHNAHLDCVNRQCWNLEIANDPKQLLPIRHNTDKTIPLVGIV